MRTSSVEKLCNMRCDVEDLSWLFGRVVRVSPSRWSLQPRKFRMLDTVTRLASHYPSTFQSHEDL